MGVLNTRKNLRRTLATTGIALLVFLSWRCGGGEGKSIVLSPIVLVSENGNGISGSDNSTYPAVSGDGRYIVFQSMASNLVSGDNNSASDIFLADTDTGIVTRVSTSAEGTEGNSNSYKPDISSDGRYIVFASDASNLVQGDDNDTRDVFLHDSVAGSISRVSLTNTGDEGDDYSQSPAISADGSYIAFESMAGNMVSNDTNGIQDIFVRDLTLNSTFRVSASSTDTQADGSCKYPDITPGGHFVVFFSQAANLVPDDNNGVDDVFVHETATGLTSRISVSSMGTEGNNGSYDGRISADGRYVVFESDAINLAGADTNNDTDIYMHDRNTGDTSRVSLNWQGLETDGFSGAPEISADGQYIVFRSLATNIVSGDVNGFEDAFVYNATSGITSMFSVSAAGTQGDSTSRYPVISDDNNYIAFHSRAGNLVTGTIDYPARNIYRAPRP